MWRSRDRSLSSSHAVSASHAILGVILAAARRGRAAQGGHARRVVLVGAMALTPLIASLAEVSTGSPAGATETPVIAETFENPNVSSPSSWVTPRRRGRHELRVPHGGHRHVADTDPGLLRCPEANAR